MLMMLPDIVMEFSTFGQCRKRETVDLAKEQLAYDALIMPWRRKLRSCKKKNRQFSPM